MNKHCKVFAQYFQGPFNILCQDTLCLEKLPLLTAFSKYVSVRVPNTSHTGLQNLLINKSQGDRSRVHMHGVEPREIALQHPWRKATREMLPKPRLFFIKRKKERGITEM